MTDIKLKFVGDFFPANLPEHIEQGIAGKFAQHKGLPWTERMKDFFKDADYSFANLESPLLNDSDFASKTIFAGSPDFGKFLNDIGINVVSIANNHILEHGDHGFQSTLNTLQKYKVEVIGISDGDTSNIHITEINGLKIGYIAFNDKHDIQNPNLYANYSPESVLSGLKRLKEKQVLLLIYFFLNIQKVQ